MKIYDGQIISTVDKNIRLEKERVNKKDFDFLFIKH